jgi:hypothetical protein
MVDVSLPGPGRGVLHCYIPLTAMGDPPPTKARHALKKGEVRRFVLAGLDPPRRVAELAFPRPEPAAPTRVDKERAKESAPSKKAAPVKKDQARRPQKAPVKKASAPAKQQPGEKAAAAKKGTGRAKKAGKKHAGKKQAVEQGAKKQPAKKQPAKKAPSASRRQR